jgi:hypothetical protein
MSEWYSDHEPRMPAMSRVNSRVDPSTKTTAPQSALPLVSVRAKATPPREDNCADAERSTGRDRQRREMS